MFDAITRSGVTRRAFEGNFYELVLWNPRDFSTNAYPSIDDRPYGGGPGLVRMPEPLGMALKAARQRQRSSGAEESTAIYITPYARPLRPTLSRVVAHREGLPR